MKYNLIAFALVLTFLSCDIISSNNNPPNISTERLDVINTSPGRIVATPVLFEKAFTKSSTQAVNGVSVSTYGVTIGQLKVTSGQLIACDPMHIDEYGKPFTQVFPTGEFPVQLAIARLTNKEKVAFARIRFSDEPVIRWGLALLKGQSPLPVGDEKMHGYSVDAGVGVFIDEEANKLLNRNEVDNMEGQLYREMDKHYHNSWRYALYNFNNQNLVAFTSGEGDGYYATYIGYDSNGKPCRLLTDFNLFNWKTR